MLNVSEISDTIFFCEFLECSCTGSTKHLSPVTFFNNVLILLGSRVNTQTSPLSMFTHGFLMLPLWCFLVKLYICLIPEVCYWTNLIQRSKAGLEILGGLGLVGGFFWDRLIVCFFRFLDWFIFSWASLLLRTSVIKDGSFLHFSVICEKPLLRSVSAWIH